MSRNRKWNQSKTYSCLESDFASVRECSPFRFKGMIDTRSNHSLSTWLFLSYYQVTSFMGSPHLYYPIGAPASEANPMVLQFFGLLVGDLLFYLKRCAISVKLLSFCFTVFKFLHDHNYFKNNCIYINIITDCPSE